MALHFTENKPIQSVSVPKTPFSIEDILHQNGNMTKSVLKSTCGNTNTNANNNTNHFISNNVNMSDENIVNNSFGKKVRNDNNDVNHTKDEEYRKVVPNER